jgi:hypothetical protein
LELLLRLWAELYNRFREIGKCCHDCLPFITERLQFRRQLFVNLSLTKDREKNFVKRLFLLTLVPYTEAEHIALHAPVSSLYFLNGVTMKKFLSTTVALATLAMAVAAPAQAALTTLTEGFSSVPGLSASGWAFKNNSDPAPLSPTPWAQGFTLNAITAQAGAQTSYAYASSNSTAGDPNTGIGDISNWLITPELDFSQGGTFSFYTRTIAGEGTTFFHNLEVRQSNSGASVNVGSTAAGLGDFTLNPLTVGSVDGTVLYPGNYPGDATNAWQQFTFSVAPTGGNGRLAFRSFYTGSGGSGQQGFIGVDTVSYTAAVPEPAAALATFMLGGFGFAGGLRNRNKKARA